MSAADVEAMRDSSWSTDTRSMEDPIREWREVVNRELCEMDVTTPVRHYSAQWQRVGLGPLEVHRLLTSPMRTVRSSAQVEQTPLPGYALMFLRKGVATLHHGEHRLRIAEGSFVLLDGESACDLTQIETAEVITGHFQDSWLRRWVAHPEQMVARSISALTSWGRPLAALLATISEGGIPAAGLPRSAIADQCGALLALMAGEWSAFASGHQDELLTRLRRILHMRFAEHDLAPAEVAATIGISKRHLHSLFAAAGTTFATTLFQIRLAAAQERLNAVSRTGSIGEIASDCGFADPSHFARRFRARYGISPTQYRQSRVGRDITRARPR